MTAKSRFARKLGGSILETKDHQNMIGTTVFSDSLQPDAHSQFQAWRRSNPDGFFLNPRSGKNKFMLHHVSCQHIGNDTWEPDDNEGETLTRKSKRCSTNYEDLEAWIADEGLSVTDCHDCIE